MHKDTSITLPCLIFLALSLALVASSGQHYLFNAGTLQESTISPLNLFQITDPKVGGKFLIVFLVLVSTLVISSIITTLIFSFSQNQSSGIKKSTSIGVFSYLTFSLMSSDALVYWMFSEDYMKEAKLGFLALVTGIFSIILTFYLIFNLGLISSMLLPSNSSIVRYFHFVGLLLTTALVLSLIFNFITQKSIEILF